MAGVSIRAFGWAWEVKGLSPSQRCVLLFLAERHNKNTGLICPSQALIAEYVEIDVRNVREALRALKKMGHIERRHRPSESGRGRRSDQYRLGCDRPEDVDGWADLPDESAGKSQGPTGCSTHDQPDAERRSHRTLASGAEQREPEGNPKSNRSEVPDGTSAAAIVDAYVVACRKAGSEPTSRDKARLGKAAKEILAEKPLDLVVAAAQRLAERNNSPAHLARVVGDLEREAQAGPRERFEAVWAEVQRVVAAGNSRKALGSQRAKIAWLQAFGDVDGRWVDLNRWAFWRAWMDAEKIA